MNNNECCFWFIKNTQFPFVFLFHSTICPVVLSFLPCFSASNSKHIVTHIKSCSISVDIVYNLTILSVEVYDFTVSLILLNITSDQFSPPLWTLTLIFGLWNCKMSTVRAAEDFLWSGTGSFVVHSIVSSKRVSRSDKGGVEVPHVLR